MLMTDVGDKMLVMAAGDKCHREIMTALQILILSPTSKICHQHLAIYINVAIKILNTLLAQFPWAKNVSY